MSTTTKSRSTVELGPQSTLEELLAGVEQRQELGPKDKFEIQRREEELASIESKIASGAINPTQARSRIAGLQQQIENIKAKAPTKRAGGLLEEGAFELARKVKEGAPIEGFEAAQGAAKDLAGLLQQAQETSGLPTEADIGAGTGLASQLFSARREQLQQSLQDQFTAAQRQAALSGRGTSDPVLAAKLRTGFTRQQDLLSAEQQAQATQISMGLPGQRLGFAAQRADVLGSVAERENALFQQGLANLEALLGRGQSLLGQEQQFRLAVAPKTTKQSQSGAGVVAGAIGGGLGAMGGLFQGIGALSTPTSFSSFVGGGQGGFSVPQAPSAFNLQQPTFSLPQPGRTFGLGF